MSMIVGGEDDLEEHLLVDLHELLVPLLDVGRLLAAVGVVVVGGGGSFLWWLHHSMTFLRTAALTLGIGIASLMASSPRSPTMFLIRTDRSATSRSTGMSSLSEDCRMSFFESVSDILEVMEIVLVVGSCV